MRTKTEVSLRRRLLPALLAAALLLAYLTVPALAAGTGKTEAESATLEGSTPESAAPSVITDSSASGGSCVRLAADGDKLSFTVSIPTAGSYTVIAHGRGPSAAGAAQLAVNDTDAGSFSFSAGTAFSESALSVSFGAGDSTVRLSYAGAATDIDYLTISNPQLSAGAVARSADDSQATVKFTSSTAGTYYYAVVDSGAAASVDTSGAGTACVQGENTLSLSGLSAGNKDVYLRVKDSWNAVSPAGFHITIPAAPTYTFSLSSAATVCAPGEGITFTVRVQAKTASAGLSGLSCNVLFDTNVFQVGAASAGTLTGAAGGATLTYASSPAFVPGTSGGTLLTFTLTAKAGAAQGQTIVSLGGISVTDGSGNNYAPDGASAAVTIRPAAPAGLSWNTAAATAGWNAVSGAASYSAQLYKNGTADGNRVANGLASGLTAPSYDFSSLIRTNGAGTYYFKVMAVAGDAAQTGGAWSDASAAYTPTLCTVSLPTSSAFLMQATSDSLSPVFGGGSYRFTFSLAQGYSKSKSFAVKANGSTLTPDSSGIYTLSNITANQTVSVEGVVAGTGVSDVPVISTEKLPAGVMGTAYSQKLTVADGSGAVTWSCIGELPAGLSLNASTGAITGTPERGGTFNFTIKAANTVGSGTKHLSIAVTGISYKITSGAESSWERNSEENLRFEGSAKTALKALLIDGDEISSSAKGVLFSGSGVTLQAAYLQALAVGEHKLELVYADGTAVTTFTVAQADPSVAPSILTQAADASAAEGGSATFTISADGTLPLLCQWQVDRGDGKGWTDIKGETGASYTAADVTAAQNGYRFRCVVTNSVGSAESAAVTLTVTSSAQPGQAGKTGGSHTWLWVLILVLALGALAALAVIYGRRHGWWETVKFWWQDHFGKK